MSRPSIKDLEAIPANRMSIRCFATHTPYMTRHALGWPIPMRSERAIRNCPTCVACLKQGVHPSLADQLTTTSETPT